MSKEPKIKVNLLWNGDEPIRARLEKMGDKVEFTKGSSHPCEIKMAKELERHYKDFEIVNDGETPAATVEAPKKTRKPRKTAAEKAVD